MTVQGAHRRVQPAALPHRRGRQEPAARDDLLLRRLRRTRHPGRELEGRLHGAALPGHAADLVRTVHPLRAPKLFNLRTDPYERADITSNTYWDWLIDRIFLVLYGSAIATQFLETFKEFPPRQEPASFTINHAVEELNKFLASRGRLSVAELTSWTDGPTKSAIVDFVGRVASRVAGLRRARRPRRGVRQRRHAVVREADVHSARLHRAQAGRKGRRRLVVGGPAAVQGGDQAVTWNGSAARSPSTTRVMTPI